MDTAVVTAASAILGSLVGGSASMATAYLTQRTQAKRAGIQAEMHKREVLYTDYMLLFQMSGIVLLVAMMGAIVLTLKHRPRVKRQDIAKQTGRKRKDAVELKDVRPGQGI